jgi:hypothetical protein
MLPARFQRSVEKNMYIHTDGSFHSLMVVDMLGRVAHEDQNILGKREVFVDMTSSESGIQLVKLTDRSGKVFRVMKK